MKKNCLINKLKILFQYDSVPSASLGEEWKISPPIDGQLDEPSEIELTERSSNQLSKLLMLQFAIDQMALEVFS